MASAVHSRAGMSSVRLALALALALLAPCALFGCSDAASHPADGGRDAAADAPGDAAGADGPVTRRPNLIFILTDDLDRGVYAKMPRLKSQLADEGTSFASHFLNISLCCPSRTAILRGQYAHNTGIFSNAPPTGGFEVFYANHSEDQTVAVWLQAAGYRTALFGKYLNGYPNTAPAAYIPPGWTEWASPSGGNPYSEFNYTLNENGTPHAYGQRAQDYLVDVIAGKASDFIQRNAALNPQPPFFLYLAPYVPHSPATPAPRYASSYPNARAPRTPSFNESDVSDKPAWIRNRAPLGATQIAAIDALYRKRLQTMLAVEDLVQTVLDTLRDTGQLDDTYIFFTSDNGFHQGQHRLDSGKNTGYDEDLFAPLVIRGPGVPRGQILTQITVNIDFAPTFAALAGIPIPDSVDGRSLVPLLSSSPPPPEAWRRAFLLEHAGPDPVAIRPFDLAGTIEPPDPFDLVDRAAPSGMAPVFVGVRTADHTYLEYATGEHELYDHQADPDQLTNAYRSADSALLQALRARVTALRNCQGAACRAAEEMP